MSNKGVVKLVEHVEAESVKARAGEITLKCDTCLLCEVVTVSSSSPVPLDGRSTAIAAMTQNYCQQNDWSYNIFDSSWKFHRVIQPLTEDGPVVVPQAVPCLKFSSLVPACRSC